MFENKTTKDNDKVFYYGVILTIVPSCISSIRAYLKANHIICKCFFFKDDSPP